MTIETKCFHADSCGGEAVVLASESEGWLRRDLPLCGGCAQAYASQAAGFMTKRLARDHSMTSPFTITLRPLEAGEVIEPAEETASFTCPKCGMTSHNPNDAREGYCGKCHDWTGARTA